MSIVSETAGPLVEGGLTIAAAVLGYFVKRNDSQRKDDKAELAEKISHKADRGVTDERINTIVANWNNFIRNYEAKDAQRTAMDIENAAKLYRRDDGEALEKKMMEAIERNRREYQEHSKELATKVEQKHNDVMERLDRIFDKLRPS